MNTLQQHSNVIALPTRAAPVALLLVMACTIPLAMVASQVVPLVVGS